MARQVPVPAHIAALKLLDRVDYADSFAVRTPVSHTAEHWARLGLEGAPRALRAGVVCAHQALGLRLARRGSPDHVLGWEIRENDPEQLVLGVEGRILTPRIVVATPPGRAVIATLIRFDRVGARAAWALVAPVHRAVARYLLDHAVQLGAPAGQAAEIGD